LVINNKHGIKTIALVDSGEDQNCIQEWLVPMKYYAKNTMALMVKTFKLITNDQKFINEIKKFVLRIYLYLSKIWSNKSFSKLPF